MKRLLLSSLVLVTIALSGCATGVAEPDETPGTAAAPSSESTPTPTAVIAVNPADYDIQGLGDTGVSFNSPDGNIACGIEQGALLGSYFGCRIAEYNYTDPTTPETQVACGHGFQSRDGGAVEVLCTGEPSPFAGVMPGGDPAVPSLDIGSSITWDDTTCVSAENGITCTGAAGQGFRIAADSYDVF